MTLKGLLKQATAEAPRAEGLAVSAAAMLLDLPVHKASISQLRDPGPGAGLPTAVAADLQEGRLLPVGSVEFVRAAMAIAGITEPDNLSYPKPLRHLLKRDLFQLAAGQVVGTWFVKPMRTKTFTGFVFDTMADPITLCEHDQEQHAAFLGMGAAETVWVSEPVTFLSEWRYYVHQDRVLGCARYDPEGSDGAPHPDAAILAESVRAMREIGVAACAIDLGVLDSGETALVEVNDAWALGLCGRALAPSQYLTMLRDRWVQMLAPTSGQSDCA